MATLFFEPSTRTRLSFEAAMHRLGGDVISTVDVKSTSLAKGESIADMARIVGSYADIIVVRHPWEGAAKVIADYAGVPVINGGDGGHQHPSQTMLDLYTIRRERHSLEGLKIALWGDLKYGRTIHSLIFALAKFGANILFFPSPGLEVPEHVLQKLVTEYGGDIARVSAKNRNVKGSKLPLDAIYVTPSSPHQLAMMPDVSAQVELATGVDALYVTRPQKERFTAEEQGNSQNSPFPVVDKDLMKESEFRRTIIMHPLPRVDELACELDSDPRSMYFTQASLGVPVRMALIALLLGLKELSVNETDSIEHHVDYPVYSRETGIRCPNSRCVSLQDTEQKYIKHQFKIVNRDPLTLRCIYCEHGFEPKFVASTEWHEGTKEGKKYHLASSHWAKKIKPDNLIIFASDSAAESLGYRPDYMTQEKVVTDA
jgi:aspartate carbamoyltransferase catalytic subunit